MRKPVLKTCTGCGKHFLPREGEVVLSLDRAVQAYGLCCHAEASAAFAASSARVKSIAVYQNFHATPSR